MTVFHSYELRYYFKKSVFHSGYYFVMAAKRNTGLLSEVYFVSQDVRGLADGFFAADNPANAVLL